MVKLNFTTVGPLQEKCVCPPPGKIYYCPPGKNISEAHASLCVDQGLSNIFVH